jgi:hypothetical protein
MECVGIFIDQPAVFGIFNPELAITRGHSIITNNDFKGDPEFLRSLVEANLRRSDPHLLIKFIDAYSELVVDKPQDNYGLLICQEAPIFSQGIH